MELIHSRASFAAAEGSSQSGGQPGVDTSTGYHGNHARNISQYQTASLPFSTYTSEG